MSFAVAAAGHGFAHGRGLLDGGASGTAPRARIFGKKSLNIIDLFTKKILYIIVRSSVYERVINNRLICTKIIFSRPNVKTRIGDPFHWISFI